jgi:hypothetical protein
MFAKNNNGVACRWNNLRRAILECSINDRGLLSLEGLIDLFLLVVDERPQSTWLRDKALLDFEESGSISMMFDERAIFSFSFVVVRAFAARVKRSRPNRDDFQTMELIGRGSFGEGT